MSTLRVTAERLTVHPHPNADALELAQVGLFRAVVAKGAYRTGDWAVYIPENALLPDALIDELGLTGRLAGSKRNRVKAIRLRGEISQGIVCRPRALADRDLAAAHGEGADFAAELGVTKWVPEIPVHMGGEVVPAPDLLRWIEVENAKRYPDVFTPGEPVVATEKIHGTACLFTLIAETGEEFASSKGHGSRNFGLAYAEDNLYWRSVKVHGVPEAARRIAERFGADRVGVFGEVFGAGVQDLGYGAGYAYDHDAEDAFSGQSYFPDGMERASFYRPAPRGFEREVAKRLDYWARLRAERVAKDTDGDGT
jgi:RNA ligase (TIGR02306 family)